MHQRITFSERSQEDITKHAAAVARRKTLAATLLVCVFAYILLCAAFDLRLNSQALMVIKISRAQLKPQIEAIFSPMLSHPMPSSAEGKGEEEEDEPLSFVPPECDIFSGQWVRDSSYPLFNHSRCTTLDIGFDCLSNLRPDRDYLRLRWQPSACHIPRFDPRDVLERLRGGGRLVFVGDSIGRNQWQSLLCMLGEAVPDRARIVEINNKPFTDHMGFFVHRFLDFNLTVEYYRSTWLSTPGHVPEGETGARKALYLDKMDNFWTRSVKGADVIVFNSGHWWNGHKTYHKGYGFFLNGTLQKNMVVEDAHRLAMSMWLRWVSKNIDHSRSQVFFRTYSPAHQMYPNGKPRKCYRDTEPQTLASYIAVSWPSAPHDMIARVVRDAHAHGGAPVHLLNTTYLTALRSDGHTSLYNRPPNADGSVDLKRCDCNHWCIPGVPDTWNALLYARLLQIGQGRWANER